MMQLASVCLKRQLGLLPAVVLLGGFLLVSCSAKDQDELPVGVEGTSEVVLGGGTEPSVTQEPQRKLETDPTQPPPSPTVPPVPFEPLSISAPDCGYGGLFETIEALDELTVRFSLCAPDVAFLAKIAFPAFAISPQEWLEGAAVGEDENQVHEKPVGTGPYLVSEWRRSENLILKAFDGYWGMEKAKMPTIVFRWNRDPAQRLLELQTGMADGIENVNSADFAIVEEDPGMQLIPRSPLNVSFLGMINLHSPFDDERVRQAIAMAIDRQRIVDEVFPSGYEVASFFTPCSLPNACAGEPWYEFDPGAAKELLDEAGYPDGFQTQLVYRDVVRGYLPRPDMVAEDIKDQLWENLKINVRIESMDPQTFNGTVDSGEQLGLYLLGWGADYLDVSNFLDTHFGADSSRQFGNKFDDVVTALEQGASLFGDEERSPFYEAANNAIRQHVPMVPISHGAWVSQEGLAVAFRDNVMEAHTSPIGSEDFAVMSIPGQDSLTWVQDEEPLTLFCARALDIESMRACAQISETLYRYKVGGTASLLPNLAESCTPNEDLTEWVCSLRQGILFHDGSALDANDVVASFRVQWDSSHPLHHGNPGTFPYFEGYFGGTIQTSE
jgi:ABC-type transport system substrate-binding protein